jgi:hypothetical protein
VIDPALIDPIRLVALMEEHGWVEVGRRSGFYLRLQHLAGSESVIVPTNPAASDYQDLLADAVAFLEVAHASVWERVLLPALSLAPADTVLGLTVGSPLEGDTP